MNEQVGYLFRDFKAMLLGIPAFALFVAGIAVVMFSPGNPYGEHLTAIIWKTGHVGRNASLLLAASVALGALGWRFDETKPLAISSCAAGAVYLLALLCRIDMPWLLIDYAEKFYPYVYRAF